MKARFDDGLTFRRLDARGKVMIEYMPAETAWYPVEADGYMHIDCFWVSGQYKGRGWANRLLDECIADEKGKGDIGLTAISSANKRPFLPDGGFLRHRVFGWRIPPGRILNFCTCRLQKVRRFRALPTAQRMA